MRPKLEVDLLTLFPAMAQGFLEASILGRAARNGILRFGVHNIRDFSSDRHQTTDDRPFGGGAGMVLKPEPLYEAWESVRREDSWTVYLSPEGRVFRTPVAQELAQKPHVILISGHYEGIDERLREEIVDEEISIGDYVLTNGTLPACVVADAVCRYVPGVLGEEQSLEQDSFFQDNLLTFPQYTRPVEFRGRKVPEILLSGNHGAIEQWRQEQRLERTRLRRPDLLEPKEA